MVINKSVKFYFLSYSMKRSRSQSNEDDSDGPAEGLRAACGAAGFSLPEKRIRSAVNLDAAKRARVYGLVAALTYRVLQFRPGVEPHAFFEEEQRRRGKVVEFARLLNEIFVAYESTPVEDRRIRFGKTGDPSGPFTLKDALRVTKAKPSLVKLAHGLCETEKLWPKLWLNALLQIDMGTPEETLISTPGIFQELREFPDEIQRIENVWRNEWNIQEIAESAVNHA